MVNFIQQMEVIHPIKEILDAIDTPGGHILILVGLGLAGVTCIFFGHPDAGKPLLEALPIAFYAMRGQEKANGKGAPVVVNVNADDKQPKP
jgi:hypothetical protein